MWAVVSVFLMSTVKFVLGGIPLAVMYYEFTFFEAVTVTSLGGFTGATFFVYSSNKLISYFKKRKAQKQIDNPKPKKKIFTRTNKIIVIVKHRFGLFGIALITPLILSIPIGCFIAVRYFKDKQRILIYMFGSILFWAITMYYLYKPLNDVIRTYLL
ncbi:MAG: hypothetical protein V4608_04190 [Bacteroidota bacterium]